MNGSPAMNFSASIPAFLFFINEILREIAAENKHRMELLNELYYSRFFAGCHLSCYELLWKCVIRLEDEVMSAQKN